MNKTRFITSLLLISMIASSASAQVAGSVLNSFYSLFKVTGSSNSVYRYSVGSLLVPDPEGNYAKSKLLKGRLARSISQRGDRILNEKARVDIVIPVGLNSTSTAGTDSRATSADAVHYTSSIDEAMNLGIRLEFYRDGTNYASCDIPAHRVSKSKTNLLRLGFALAVSQKHKRDGTLTLKSKGGKCQALIDGALKEVLPPYRKGDRVDISLVENADSLFDKVLVVGTTKDKELVPQQQSGS